MQNVSGGMNHPAVAGNKTKIIFLGATAFLVLLGLAFMASSSIPLSQKNFNTSYHYLWHQILYGFVPGLVLFFLFSNLIKFSLLRRLALPLMLGSLLLLILVFVPHVGYGAGGAKRWIDAGVFSFQPSELAKFALIIYLAYWLERKKDKIKKPNMVLPLLFWLVAVTALIFFEPDYGTLALIWAIGLVMYFSACPKMKTFAGTFFIVIALLASLVFLAPYRRDRLYSFLNPQHDAAGKNYQRNQALIAIGSGGLTGLGLGKGVQKYNYLPETIGDSAFAIVSEETGFLGGAFVSLVYLFWILSGLKIAVSSRHCFGRYLAVGIVIWIGLQAFVNIFGILGMIPFTGIPLPFISYGGSALMVELAAVGLMVHVAKK